MGIMNENGRLSTPFFVLEMAEYRNEHGYNLTNSTFGNVNYYGMHFNWWQMPNWWSRVGEMSDVNYHPLTTEVMYEIESWRNAADYLGGWTPAEEYAYGMIQDMNGNCSTHIDWNMMLNQQGGPSWSGRYATSATYSDPNDPDVFYKNPIYYVHGHFSRLIKQGWNKRSSRVDGIAPFTGIMMAIMENPEITQRVAVIVNRYSEDQDVNYWDHDLKKEVAFTLPKKSITSIYYSLK